MLSVTLHGRPVGGFTRAGQAMMSCRLESNYSSKVILHGRPVVFRPVRATFCFTVNRELTSCVYCMIVKDYLVVCSFQHCRQLLEQIGSLHIDSCIGCPSSNLLYQFDGCCQHILCYISKHIIQIAGLQFLQAEWHLNGQHSKRIFCIIIFKQICKCTLLLLLC